MAPMIHNRVTRTGSEPDNKFRNLSSILPCLKAALRDAVTERWLAGISAPDRLQRWLDLFIHSKRRQGARRARALRHLHRAHRRSPRGRQSPRRDLLGQLTGIIADGVTRREFRCPGSGRGSQRGVRRHHSLPQPAQAASWFNPNIDASYENVRALVLAGFTPKRAQWSG
jgi:hypothetical protein